MIVLPRERFEQLVSEALDSLPIDLGHAMENVAVVVDDGEDPALLGLYEGIPLTSRYHYGGIGMALPDRITIYQLAICGRCNTEEQVAAEVRRVVIHEVGHHFGIDDGRLQELGWG